jgi:hypothetical protein
MSRAGFSNSTSAFSVIAEAVATAAVVLGGAILVSLASLL